MPKIVYVGPFDEVDVPALRLRAVPGEPVEVGDADADALLAQPDNWAKPNTKRARDRAELHRDHREAFERAVAAGTAGIEPGAPDELLVEPGTGEPSTEDAAAAAGQEG